MKRICDHTEAELLALTDEAIATLVDYGCALEGVPMLPPHPGAEPRKIFPQPDAECYQVAGVLTRSADHAARILAAISSGEIVSAVYDRDYNNKYVKCINHNDFNYPKISAEIYRSPEQWDAIKGDHEQFDMIHKQWEDAKMLYDKALKERSTITEDVYARLAEARDRARYREQLRTEFARYLELAEGNRQIALNFLEKVKSLEDYPELREEFLLKEVG